MGKTAMKLLGMGDKEFYEGMGVFFVALAQNLGYGMLLSSLGRCFRDFFVNLDNLHDYLKFTFPRMKAPSFFIAEEAETGMTMEYRSKRRGFQFYVQGQIKELSKNFATEIKKLDIELKKQEVIFDTVVTYYELKFENQGYITKLENEAKRKVDAMPIKASIIFEMFPFCILYNSNMEVTILGSALRQILSKNVGQGLGSFWELVKPLVEFKWEVILSRLNSMFELATQEEVDKLCKTGGGDSSSMGFDDDLNLLDEDIDKTLHIKGQMVWIADWDQMLFLACPMMNEVMKKSDDLISQMLPKSIADELAKGKTNEQICKAYDCVTMLFSDIVTFTVICSKLKPIQVVQLLNNMYTLFDFLCDQNAVYKVETIGDAYLIVAGCPVKAANHALKICDMAFDMMDGIKILKVPGSGDDIHMRIGVHSGPVVAGVVGLKMPRYCLFGVNVGLTEKFEANSKPDRIHISETTIENLSSQYKTEERNDEGLKMKVGGYKSSFLNSKDNRKPLQEAVIKALLPTEKEAPKISKEKKDAKKEEPKKDAKKEEPKKAEPPKAEAPKPAAEAPKAQAAPPPAAAPPPPPAAAAPPPPPPDAGGGGGADEAAPEPDTKADDGAAEDEGDGGDGGGEEAGDDGIGVEMVQQTQCCGGLKKSAVCSVL